MNSIFIPKIDKRRNFNTFNLQECEHHHLSYYIFIYYNRGDNPSLCNLQWLRSHLSIFIIIIITDAPLKFG